MTVEGIPGSWLGWKVIGCGRLGWPLEDFFFRFLLSKPRSQRESRPASKG